MNHTAVGKSIFCSITVCLIVGTSTALEDAAPTSEPQIESAKAFLNKLAAEEFDAAALSFDDAVKKALPPKKLQQTWKQLTTALGPLESLVDSRSENAGRFKAVIVTCQFKRGQLEARVVFDSEEKITGLWFVPPASPAKYAWPRYADSKSFDEKEVMIGMGEWALPGTLTLPKGEGPFPAVILVHGSGPNDRDETIGPTKVFRDLAGGLATQGIAVLRYDKRTKVHPTKLAKLEKGITLKEETIDDAVLAFQLLQADAAIDPARIFLLGHSLGGYVAPRIALAAPELAGLIILAGSTRPLEDIIVDQYRYHALSDGEVTSQAQKMLNDIAEQVAKVKTLTAESDLPKKDLPLGVPKEYWMDMRSYDPVETAKGLSLPMLILQGGRDYQVTAADYCGWYEGLAGKENVTLKWFSTLNHLFIAGSKKSAPAEYMQPGHVSPRVIEIVVSWIKRMARPVE